MANKFTRFLSQVGTGLINPKGNMGNFQHATRLFVDDTYRLAPRTKFMYYVRFEIDPTAHQAPMFTNRHVNELGLLVKSCDLPKFNIDSVTKNQYNRKKLVYKQINYEPMQFTFHDDSAGVVNALWAIYYGTYFADRHMPTQAYSATHLRGTKIDAFDNFRYGLDNNKTVDLFKSISIYTMSRRRFLGYTLVNPRITQWSHGNVDTAASEFLDNTMQVQYEAVKYSGGNVTFDNPKGFATLHYDTVPSPLSVAGGGVANLIGEGGVLDGMEQIFGDISSGVAFDSIGGFLGTAIKSVNTYKNFKNLSKDSIKGEVINIISSPGAISGAVNTVGGIIGAVFPKNTGADTSTAASIKKLF
jgi:hypothetical protein